MRQLIYQIIYDPRINAILRTINKLVSPVLPEKIKLPPSGILKIKNSEGDSVIIKTNQTNYPTFLVYWNGYENFEYTDIFIHIVKKIDCFLDVGSNIGYYSLIAAMENKTMNIIAFEPATGPLHYLQENVKINDFQNIKIESIALSHKIGEIEFHERPNAKYKYLDYNLAGDGNANTNSKGKNFVIKTVKTTTFNRYVELNEIENIDLVKLDTEGTEHLILEQADLILQKMKPIIICETLFNTIEHELDSIMRSYGYEFYNHIPSGLQKVETIIRKEENGISNCFFVHPEKYYLIEEFVVN